MSKGIPGFEILDADGNVIAANPGQQPSGRRTYNEDGIQVPRKDITRKPSHDYLLRAPRGLWVAFSRKCKNEGISAKQALVFLMKDWTTGKIEIHDLPTRKS